MPGENKQESKDNFGFVDTGPPPDMRQRELIFDSLTKIVTTAPGRGRRAGSGSRGSHVATWGAGYLGQLGMNFIRGQKKYSATPLMLDMDVVVRQVHCGGVHTAAVTETGDVYTWGDGSRGQLGQNAEPTAKQTPRSVGGALDGAFIVEVACGGAHTVCLSDNGRIWSWGWAKYGQTGHGDRDRSTNKLPRMIQDELARDIIKISAGAKHTVAVNKKGLCISFGCGEHGQTGQGDNHDPILVPTRIQSLQDANKVITQVACGSIHTCFITDDGEVWLCGFGEYFHVRENERFFYTPKKIEMPEPIKQISCGQSHNVALSVTGDVYCWGSGEYGQLGYGILGNLSTPRLVLENKRIAQVAAGRYHSFALSDTGVLYSWGCGENGQLGLGPDENTALPSVVHPILGTVVGQIACGEHHTAALTSAPWSKLSHDVTEWYTAAKAEHDFKILHLKKRQGGLNRKDLAIISQEMVGWYEEYKKKKEKQALEDQEELEREKNSIQYEQELMVEVAKEFEEGKGKTMKLPELGQAGKLEGKLEEDTVGEPGPKQTVKFPKVVKKKTVKDRKISSARSDGGSPTKNQPQQNANDKTQVLASASVTRTNFLKETAQMVARMKTVIQDNGESQGQKHLQAMIRTVFEFRKEFDALRAGNANKSHNLDKLKKEFSLLNQSATLGEEYNQGAHEKLKGLMMQLNTVTIKIAETSENRQNYETNINHLKEDDFAHFNQLKELRKKYHESNSFYKKMSELKTQAIEEKEKAEQELHELKDEIQSYQKFVNSQLQQFEQILNIIRRQNEKREEAKLERNQKMRAKISQRIEKLEAEAEAADIEAGGLTARLTSLDLKLRHFEDSFQKITAATGLTNPDAIVNKFFFKGEIKEQLQAEIEDKEQLIKELRQTVEERQKALEEAKANFKDQTWRDVDVVSESSREVDHRLNKGKKEIDRVAQKLALLQEGLLSMSKNVHQAQDLEPEFEVDAQSMWSTGQAGGVFGKLLPLMDELLEAEREYKAQAEQDRLIKEELAAKNGNVAFKLLAAGVGKEEGAAATPADKSAAPAPAVEQQPVVESAASESPPADEEPAAEEEPA